MTVGDADCSVISATYSRLTCYVPFAPLSNIDQLCHGGAFCGNRSAPATVSWGFDVSGASLAIETGATVTWAFDQNSGVTHDVTSGPGRVADGLFASGPLASGTFSHTFPAAGTYGNFYFCIILTILALSVASLDIRY